MARPAPRFLDFIGQQNVVGPLQTAIQGARTRQEPFPHVLVMGPSGVGKSLLATAIAREYGTKLVAPANYAPEEIAATIISLEKGDFLFLDEAHNLKPACQELLYPVIDKLEVRNFQDAVPGHDGASGSDRPSTIPVKPFTVVAATDKPGKLANALHRRLVYHVFLDRYLDTEMKEIVERVAAELNMLTSPQAAKLIARISSGLPRTAKHHLMRIRLHFADSEACEVDVGRVRKYLTANGIDARGLGYPERRYLERLAAADSGVSLGTLAKVIGTDTDFVADQIEPTLFRHRLVDIRPGGRHITEYGHTWLLANQNEEME